MNGRIIKGLGGSYEVMNEEGQVYTCSPKGIFRYRKEKPLIGDSVRFSVLNEEDRTGNLEELLPRTNALIRPAVANVDQAVVVFSAGHPRANLNLLDRFLVLMKSQGVPVIICFNKTDTATEEDLQLFQETYKNCGSPLLFVSAGTGEGLNKLQRLLEGKTSVFAGSSGVGKSSLINALSPRMALETGEISHKIKRGKHTTRHTSLLYLYKATYVLDTPGFSSLYLTGITPEQVRDSYLDFLPFISSCRFLGCVHIGEQACGVKEAVQHGLISPVRYRNYTLIYEEQKNSLNTYR